MVQQQAQLSDSVIACFAGDMLDSEFFCLCLGFLLLPSGYFTIATAVVTETCSAYVTCVCVVVCVCVGTSIYMSVGTCVRAFMYVTYVCVFICNEHLTLYWSLTGQ